MQRIGTLLILAIGLTGCLEAVEPEPVYQFGGLTQQGEPGWEHIRFESAFVWYENQEILVVGARVQNDVVDPEIQETPVRSWRVHTGTCAAGGQVIGQDAESFYPNLNVDLAGDARRENFFNAVIDITASYHAKLYASPVDDTMIACVNFSQMQVQQ